ncbi:UDP-N-acetylglucosamine 1-carboxyvinyltransferase [Candidatus Aerophobetes bacterium]|uniref:UDP-N-acetylglucosamine 1-carboxyvinyltransferase n=1 Tax=Aerophobetes bacterium TaxID=2030807 RepID=A0A497E6A4_UNCAE|nr:MAG: UDP-N-acetylglucosamine 1-carboxyvinyltransferase [Candidatus Aerophobetes bacterium]
MGKFIIEGGVPLKGKVRISGAKNSALPLMAACLLTEGRCQLKNVPQLVDIITMKKVLEGLGSVIERENEGLKIDCTSLSNYEAPYELVRMMRASILVLGPLLARLGRARVSLPGGCAIGRRPVDLHLKGLVQMGAKIEVREGYIEAYAKRGLKGDNIYLDLPSVGATENIMLAASVARGVTVIEGASRAPEIIELATFLRKMGAKIEGVGTDSIRVEGVRELHPASYSIIPDRIEAGTLLIAGAITGGEVVLKEILPHHLGIVLAKLREMGMEIEVKDNQIRILGNHPRPVKIKTLPYPGFPTDLQPQMTSLACLAQGTSIITETVFEDRFAHIAELQRMGAQIERKGQMVIVKGVPFLEGTIVKASDIRGGAALVLAGLAARGVTQICDIHHIDRGYERLEEKLSRLGARIKRVEE